MSVENAHNRPIYLTPGRCYWCKRFVRADYPPTCWAVQPAEEYRQIEGDSWNLYARTLCPDCAKGNDREFSFRKPVSFRDVESRAAELSQDTSKI